MQFTYAVHLLRQFYSQHAHGKFLMPLIGMEPSQIHKLIPGDFQPFRIVCHIGPQQVLLKESDLPEPEYE